MASFNAIAGIVSALGFLTVAQPTGAQNLQEVQKQCSGNDGVPRHQQINACTRLIESSTLAPEHLANAFYNRGRGYKANGDFDRAIADFHQATRLNPTDADAFCNRGLSYFGKRDNDRAITDFDEAISLNPNLAEAFYGRGLARSAKGDHDKAITDFDQVIRLDPANASAFYQRGNAYAERGEQDRAIEDFSQAAKLNPNNGDVFNLNRPGFAGGSNS